MTGSQSEDFAERVKDYADALALGDMYKEPGDPVDCFGLPVPRARRRCECGNVGWSDYGGKCITCCDDQGIQSRIAAMRAGAPESASIAALDNELLTPNRYTPDWSKEG